MEIGLHNLQRAKRKFHKRAGRGNSGYRGNFSGRGTKGQNARTGGKHKGGFSGKKVPNFILKLPKNRGFRAVEPKYEVVNIKVLNQHFNEGDTITPSVLLKQSMIRDSAKVKILGTGALTKKFIVEAHAFSQSALRQIKKSGGETKIISKK